MNKIRAVLAWLGKKVSKGRGLNNSTLFILSFSNLVEFFPRKPTRMDDENRGNNAAYELRSIGILFYLKYFIFS